MNSLLAMDKKHFWDRKILVWEKKNYEGNPLWGSAIRGRQQLFLQLVRPVLSGATVFEAGCGSAQLLEKLFDAGIKSYVGCDISSAGIQEAKARAVRLGVVSKTEFREASATDAGKAQADLSFSLGLWDWLSDGEIHSSLNQVVARYVLHSYSERRRLFSQFLHRAYVYSAYGHKNLSYTPIYRPTEEIVALMNQAGILDSKIYRNSKMSFSSFTHNLSLGR